LIAAGIPVINWGREIGSPPRKTTKNGLRKPSAAFKEEGLAHREAHP